MKFIDSVSIKVAAGDGGDGCVSLHREKYIAFGGPDGGDGGDGGDVFAIGSHHLSTLGQFRYKSIFKAENGGGGSGQNRRGKSASPQLIKMPLGTQIYNAKTDELIGELLKDKQKILLAQGGFHGLGNSRFKSAVNRTPRQFTKGTKGEQRILNLELKLIADVGLLGLPNAGKSSFIATVSAAKPKVAAYPFTTLQPNLAVAHIGYERFVIADIPGVIKNASSGAGLGLTFLKHLTRAKVLLHIVDIAPEDGSNPINNYRTIITEISQYSSKLANKPSILAINKIDRIAEESRVQTVHHFIKAINYQGDYSVISTLKHLGLSETLAQLHKIINQ